MASYILSQAYGGLLNKAGHTQIDYDSHTIQMIWCASGCNVDSVRHTATFVADVTLDEYDTATGYARPTLASKTMTISSTNNGQIVFSSAALAFSSIAGDPGNTVTRLLFSRLVTNDADSPIIAVLDLTTTVPSQVFIGTGNDISITPPVLGWFHFANNE